MMLLIHPLPFDLLRIQYFPKLSNEVRSLAARQHWPPVRFAGPSLSPKIRRPGTQQHE